MEDSRVYNIDEDHPSKLQVLICIKLDRIIDQNQKIIGILEMMPEARDFFAASQFSDLSDDEKLSRPDFDQMESGKNN